jgi:cytochrome c-type biogenesis protein CcmH
MRLTAALASAIVALTLLAPAALGSTPTLAAIEDEVMCTVCGVPLSMAREAPAAKRERALIQELIAAGKTEPQIKAELVATYGNAVLIEPTKKGFDLVAWLVPVVLTIGGAALLVWLLVRWRRSSPDNVAPTQVEVLSEADAQLVDSALRDSD